MKKILASSLVLAAAALTVSTAVSAYEDIASLTAKDPEVVAAQGTDKYKEVYQSVYQRINNEAAYRTYDRESLDEFNKDSKNAVEDYNKAQNENNTKFDPTTGKSEELKDLTKEQLDQVRANSADYNNIKGSTYSSTSSEASSSASSEASSSASSEKGSKETKSTEVAVKEAKKAAKAAAKEGQKVLPNTAAVK